jgi:hypothetical protein
MEVTGIRAAATYHAGRATPSVRSLARSAEADHAMITSQTHYRISFAGAAHRVRGLSDGKLARFADHVVHVAVDNYGMAEDAHQSVMHGLTQYLRARNQR